MVILACPCNCPRLFLCMPGCESDVGSTGRTCLQDMGVVSDLCEVEICIRGSRSVVVHCDRKVDRFRLQMNDRHHRI